MQEPLVQVPEPWDPAMNIRVRGSAINRVDLIVTADTVHYLVQQQLKYEYMEMANMENQDFEIFMKGRSTTY